MKAFHFRLEALLRLRHAAEATVRRQLIEANTACRSKEEELNRAGVRIKEWSEYYNDVLLTRFNAVELAVIDRHIQKLFRLKEQLTIGLEILNRKKEDLIRQYEEARRQVKVLEHVRARRREEYNLDLRHEEEKEADEMAVLRFAGRLQEAA